MKYVALLALIFMAAWSTTLEAQRGGRGAAPPATPRQMAPFDVTGYWVSVVAEDWKYRMVTPKKGVFDGVPLNPEGRKVGEGWDPARDEAAGEQCKAYGAGAIMRVPGRLNISWQDDRVLKIETDAGTQTRLFRFAASSPPTESTWQGHSVAQWNVPGRSLKVVTTNLRAGYVRRNGVPYSDKTTVTEYWDLNTLPNGDQWLTVTTELVDPTYFARPYVTSSDFKKLPGPAGWNPTPCAAK